MENWINQLKTSWSTTPSQGHWPDLKTEMVFRKPKANKILTKQYRSQNQSDRRLRLKAVRQEVVCAAGERIGNWYENRIKVLWIVSAQCMWVKGCKLQPYWAPLLCSATNTLGGQWRMQQGTLKRRKKYITLRHVKTQEIITRVKLRQNSCNIYIIPHILCKLKFYYHIYKRPSSVPTLSQLSPVHASPSNFLKIHFNIIFPSMPKCSKGLLPSGFPTKILCPLPLSLIRATGSARIILHYLITWIRKSTLRPVISNSISK